MKSISNLFLLLTLGLTLVFWLEVPTGAFAAVPQAINYQAIARDGQGAPLANKSIKVRATIRRSTAGGPIDYQETHVVTTSPGGQFAIPIGGGAPSSGTFAAIDWANFKHYLEIEIDPNGGNSFIGLGTMQMLSVPYAQHSQTTDAVSGTAGRLPRFLSSGNALGSSVVTESNGRIGINDATPQATLDVAGSGNFTLDLSANGASFTGDLTVNGGKGVIRNSAGAGQLKYYTRAAGFGATLGAFGSVDATIGFTSSLFSNPPQVMVGDIVTGATGDFHKVRLVLFDVTKTGCKARLYNSSNATITFVASWTIVCIGE